ncbi:hypothetical protein OR1_04025 [Geobacter sp. OR-1]|nr:hypothetical protein OR1_04025 [Geobacter sp. OR-1]
MADLRLYRAEGAPGCVGFPVDFTQGGNFNAIAHLGPCAVGLNQTDAVRSNSGALIGIEQGLFLPRSARRVNGVPLAVAGRTNTLDHAIDSVAIPLGIGKPLDDHYAETLAENSAVAAGIERLGVSGGG